MSISLQKGQKVSLSKEKAGLSRVLLGLGWDEAPQPRRGLFSAKPRPIDCDASLILLKDGKWHGAKDLVYFGNLNHASGAVKHMGDNLTGAGDGDDEQIVIDLSTLPGEYDHAVVVVNIYQAKERGQHFGLISNAFVRIVDAKANQELFKYNLSDDYAGMTAMIFGELYRQENEWKFSAIGQGTTDNSLSELVKRYK